MLAIFIMLANSTVSTSNDAALGHTVGESSRPQSGWQTECAPLCVGKGLGEWRSGSKISIVFRKERDGRRVPMSSDRAQTYYMSSCNGCH